MELQRTKFFIRTLTVYTNTVENLSRNNGKNKNVEY